jgi:hypothetical protein
MAAFAHVPVVDALNALDAGLAGRTRGLVQFGIVVSQQQIHLEAMRQGLLQDHQTLTQLGTAEIAQQLIMQAATRIQGEAARTAGDASNSFKFLKRDVEELGTSIGSVMLPPTVALVDLLKSGVDTVNSFSDGTKKILVFGAAVAATLGPAVLVFARMAKELIALRAIYVAFEVGEGLSAVLAAVASAPFALIAGGIALVTAAVAALYAAFGSPKAVDMSKLAFQSPTAFGGTVTNVTPLRPPPMAGGLTKDDRSPLQVFKDNADLIQSAYKNAVDSGAGLVEQMQQINALHTLAIAKLAAQNGQWNDMAKAAAEVVQKSTPWPARSPAAQPRPE